MACRNLCERFNSRFIVGGSHYANGKKYCRRGEVYILYDGIFCPCCGMVLGTSPTNKRDKERLRQLQLRIGEQDRIVRIIKGIKK
jgi:hypothetical protein